MAATTPPIPTTAPPPLNRRARTARSSAIRDLLDHSRMPGMISLAGGIPDAERFPLALLADLADVVIGVDGRTALQYGTTDGEAETRRALTRLYGPAPSAPAGGPMVTADDLVITSGAQQAIDLVARVVLEPGDRVVCAEADYLGFLGVLADHGAVPHPVPIDRAGLDVERLGADLAAGLRPRACYLVPHHHNPTGATIAAERRAELHRLSAHYGFLVIEDDPYRELHIGPVEAEADPALTLRIRSLSKVLAPGLRLGTLAGPRELTEAVVIQKQSADLHTSTLSQALAVAAIDTGFLDDHVAGLRRAYRAKLDALATAVETVLGDRVTMTRPSGGMFLWIRADGVDTTAWLDRALDLGVCFVPGSAFAVGAPLTDRARLSFVTVSEREMADGVDRLAAALPPGRPASHRPGAGH